VDARVQRHADCDQLIAQYTSDNGSDLKRMRDLLENDHDDCISHVLNSGYGDVMATPIQMTKDFKTMQHLVSTIESDKNLKLCFDALQLQCSDDFTEALEFVHYNDTRWLSSILFMERFARFEKVFCDTDAEYHSIVFSHVMAEFPLDLSTDVLRKDFFLRLNGYIEVSKAYKFAQLTLQSIKRPTGSLVVPLIGGMIQACKVFRSSVKGVVEFSETLGAAIEGRGSRYLTNVSNYLKCSLLDPSQCHSVSEFVADDIITEAWDDITAEISSHLAHDHPDMSQDMCTAGAKFQASLLRSTLKQSDLPADAEDPLQFYRSLNANGGGGSMGAALTVVRQLLGIPAGESHCERCFSWADGFVTKLRNRTGNQALEMQIILYEEFSRPDFQWESFRQAFIERLIKEFESQQAQAKK
jgi:hypothetical protein